MPDELCQDIARLSELNAAGCYTHLGLPHNVSMDEQGRCIMQRVNWPTKQFKWHLVGRPGGHQNIALEEMYATLWSNEARLNRPTEHHVKVIQGIDNTVGCGAFLKGRSSFTKINAICRANCAVMITGFLEAFYPWVPSKDNPADDPSS